MRLQQIDKGTGKENYQNFNKLFIVLYESTD